MLKFVAFLLIFNISSSTTLSGVETMSFETGDVLLQPLSCWSCKLIEDQENSEFSHIGIVVKLNQNVFVAEALGSVKLTPIKAFLKRTKKDKQVKLLRSFYLSNIQKNKIIVEVNKRVGFPYDKSFLWDNFENGNESFYCSEFVYKVLISGLQFRDLKPKEMLFDINPSGWDKYFKNKTPRGEIGLSPEDFNKSFDFEEISNL